MGNHISINNGLDFDDIGGFSLEEIGLCLCELVSDIIGVIRAVADHNCVLVAKLSDQVFDLMIISILI